MKRIFISFFLLLISYLSIAQHPFWGNLTPGQYQVGFKDTVVFKSDESFDFHDYHHAKPFFISIWYPAQNDTKTNNLKYQSYWDFTKSDSIKMIADTMRKLYEDALKNYGICTNINKWKELKFGKNQQKLLDSILNTNIIAKRNLNIAEGNFPCIVYHHGAGGTNDDNSVFCEYFASHGFVVISSNFHWPLENLNALGNKYPSKAFNFTTDVLFVSDFAENLPFTDKEHIIFAGHSAGGQRAFFLNALGRKNPFKLFLIYDTTLEGRSINWIKNRNSAIDSLFVNHSDRMVTPSYIFTAPTKYYGMAPFNRKSFVMPKFEIFRTLNSTPITFITSYNSIDHENFISQGTYRAIYAHKIKQNDRKEVIYEFNLYHDVVKMSLDIIQSFLSKESPDNSWKTNDTSKFQIESINQ